MSNSTLSKEVLEKYKSRIFIETGTGAGEGIQIALDAGFERVYSIESNPDVFKKACERYKDNPKVVMCFGDSGSVLPELLNSINELCTFWLDAHWSTGEAEPLEGVSKCPILEDLRAIARHKIRSHIIMIDDMRYFKNGGIAQWYNIKLGDIMEVIMNINPEYFIAFEDGHVHEDILVAEVK